MTRNTAYVGRTDPADVPFSSYVSFVRRHLILLICATLVGGVVGAGLVAKRTPRWTSTATVLLTSAPAAIPGWVTENQTELLPPTVDTEAQLVESQKVVGAVAKQLDEGLSPEQVRESIHVGALSHTRLLRITVTARRAAQAKAAGRAAANAYLAERGRLEDQLRGDLLTQLRLHAAALRRTIDELPPRGVVARPRDPNQRRRAVLRAIDSVERRISAIRDGADLPGQLVSVGQAIDKTQANRTIPPVSGAVVGLLLGVLLSVALDVRRRPRDLPLTQVPWTSPGAVSDGLQVLRHALSRTPVGPIVCVEGVDSADAADELAVLLAGQLMGAGLHVSAVTGEAAAVSPDLGREHAPERLDEDRTLRQRVLAVWLADPWADRVVAAIADPATTEELLTAPVAEALCSDVVLLHGPRTRLEVVQRRRDRLRSLGGRVHLATGRGGNIRVELDLTAEPAGVQLAPSISEG